MINAKHNSCRGIVCIRSWKEQHPASPAHYDTPGYTAEQKPSFLADFMGCLILLTFSLWDKTWSRSCHPRRSTDLGLGSSQHRQTHRCGSDARIPGWPLHLSSHTTVAAEGNGKIYFICGGASPEAWLTHLKTFQLILELTQDQEGSRQCILSQDKQKPSRWTGLEYFHLPIRKHLETLGNISVLWTLSVIVLFWGRQSELILHSLSYDLRTWVLLSEDCWLKPLN